jgi:hypothetical protein
MLKKILLSLGVLLVLLIGSLVAIPYFFQDEIKAKIAATINENLDAKVSFADTDLSLFKSFPQANVAIEKLVIINKAPFEGDTLVSFGELNLKMSIKELFKGKDEPLNIEALSTKNSVVNIIFNKDGIGNFEIALKDKKDEKDAGKSDPLNLKISQYEVENMRFTFKDDASKIKMVLDSINHTGTGDFAAEKLDLDTQTTAKVSLDMDKVNYMRNVALSLDAVLGIDLAQSKYTFKENKAKINELPLEFDGFIQMVEAGQVYDLKFKTPTSSFKNFLGLIPAAYASSLDNVKTTGNFTVSGFAKGTLTDTTVPKFNIAIASNNASFQYPDLPKSVQNIIIDTKIINETGLMNDTYVNLDKLSFSIDQDVFNAKASIKNVATNALVDAVLKGTINLGNFTKAYPIKLDTPLSGILKADVTTKFDIKSVETSQYQNINNAGTMQLSGFKYSLEKGKNLTINNAIVQFNPSRVNLQEFKAKTGKSDINLTGVLENFYGFMFRNQNLLGNFNMVSNQISITDFMTTTEPTKTETKAASEPVKIPAFLDCSLTAKANTVLYDNLILKNVAGKLIIKDQAVTLQNVNSDVFGGKIGMNGTVSTKQKTPTFNMKLNLNKVDIPSTFTQLEMLKKIAPIAGVINGKLNSTISLSGNLDAKKMTPDLKTLSGDLLGQLLDGSVNSSNSKLLSTLDSNLNFVDLSKLNLKDLKAALTFKDSKVNIKPFDIKYQDIKVNVGGSHGFDQNMKYDLKFDVPAKYLGNEVNALIAKLTPADAKKLDNIPVNAILNGTFSNPKVTTDVKAATTTLVTNLAKQQKDKLVKEGTTKLGSLIDKNIKKPGDTSKTVIPTTKQEVKEKVKEEATKKAGELLNGLFNKKK